jgi:hypothetical protein
MIPLIGVVGLNKDITDLAVLIDQSQHYRNLFGYTFSLQFLYKTKVDGGKTLMITCEYSL